MNYYHLEHSFSSRKPVPHNSLHQRLSFKLKLINLQDIFNSLALGGGKLGQQLGCLLLLEVHDGVEHHVDGVQYVHAEGSLVVLVLGLAPLLCLGVEEILSPKLLHHFVNINSELASIHLSELLKGESPSMEPRSESNGTVVDIHTDNSHRSIVVTVGGNNDVDVLNNPLEGLVEFLLSKLKLEKSSVHFVHEKNGTNPLSNSLSEYSLGLDTHT